MLRARIVLLPPRWRIQVTDVFATSAAQIRIPSPSPLYAWTYQSTLFKLPKSLPGQQTSERVNHPLVLYVNRPVPFLGLEDDRFHDTVMIVNKTPIASTLSTLWDTIFGLHSSGTCQYPFSLSFGILSDSCGKIRKNRNLNQAMRRKGYELKDDHNSSARGI